MRGAKWQESLPDNVYLRLCECRNIKADIPILVNARWAWMKTQEKYKGFTKEDAVVCIFDWLDANSQWNLVCDVTVDEYKELCS